MEKERLDLLLVQRNLFPSREKARSAIMAGIIYVNGEKADKPGTGYPKDSEINVKENPNPYVSRGGLKLEKAIREFGVRLQGVTALDIGASTGGFTDCMLKNGAQKVFAIDVGYGQLAWELRNDPRVVCMERTNIRYVKPEDIGVPADFASIDVSFISLKKVLPVAAVLTGKEARIVCLIKPQFEAGREKVGKHGVVREAAIHLEVIRDILNFAKEKGFYIRGLTYSPIKGPEGNIEYLLYLDKAGSEQEEITHEEISAAVVQAAHEGLNKAENHT